MLVVFSAVTGRKKYLAYAMPMGLVDALVPFAGLNIDVFEAGIFTLSLLFMYVAWVFANQVNKMERTGATTVANLVGA